MATFHPIDLDFEESGEGIPLVLLHGFPFNRSTWYPLLPYLKTSARIILPDLRGHGCSAAGDEPATMRLMAEDVAVLLSKLKIERFILAGHSMGGYVSLAFAQAYPQRLLGLGLVATMAANDTPEKRQARFKTIESIKNHGTDSLAKDMPARLSNKEELQQQLAAMIKSADSKGVINALKGMVDRPDFTEMLPSISAPTVIIAGQNDVVVPQERIEVMARLLRRNWVVEIPNAGHMPMMEAPELVAKAFIDLIQIIK